MTKNTTEEKRDAASKLDDIAKDFMEFVESEFPDNNTYFADKIEENVRSLLDVGKPKVMVYGIYNSGKSTLINSLCKEEVAETADRPMTDQIAEYDRGDYYLVDSPGVDAPIQHELVTEEYLNKCHIILFVISSKGLFEDRTNYKKLANLIVKDIPFIIVLNERGCHVEKKWDDEKKKRARFDHNQELKVIQYKIIQNLIKESNDKKIVDKYEVVVLNAKKAWTGVVKEKPKLYEDSGVEFLDQRISRILNSSASVSALFKQPISNLKECLNEIEKMVTQAMSGNASEDFGMRLHVLESKKDNLMQDMRILTQQAVKSHLDELTNAYVQGDTDLYESIATSIFMDVDDRYTAKLNELLVYVDHNFKELNLYFDYMSNLAFDFSGKVENSKGKGIFGDFFKPKGSGQDGERHEGDKGEEPHLPEQKRGFFDFLKTRNQRERERRERLEMEARLKNEAAQYKLQEQMRKRQEARQLADSDLDALYREFISIVNQGLDEKYDELISQIQEIDCLNKQVREDGKRQMDRVKELRRSISAIENSLNG